MTSPTPPARENESDLAYGERMARDRDQFLSQRDALAVALDRLATEVRAIVFIESDAKMMELLADADAALRPARGDGK